MEDEIDKLLHHQFDCIDDVPSNISKELETIVHKTIVEYDSRKQNVFYHITKIGIAACFGIVLTAGGVYASKVVYDKIWKNPEKVVGFYSGKNQNTITEKTDNNIMSEDEAKNKANKLLKMFGHEGEKIKTIQLENNPFDYSLNWYIQTKQGNDENIIEFNAKGEDEFSVMFQDTLNESIHQYRIEEKDVENVARNLCKKYGYDTEKYNKIEIRPNMENAENSYIWYVDFYKEYDGMMNPYEKISIGFVAETNEIYYFNVKNLKFENNTVEITKEQAQQIALNTDKELNIETPMKNVETTLSIKKMNGDAYKRIKNFKQYYEEKQIDNYPVEKTIEYRTEEKIRKVFEVTIEYNLTEVDNKNKFFNKYYTYFVDATTGEIIGGCPYKI